MKYLSVGQNLLILYLVWIFYNFLQYKFNVETALIGGALLYLPQFIADPIYSKFGSLVLGVLDITFNALILYFGGNYLGKVSKINNQRVITNKVEYTTPTLKLKAPIQVIIISLIICGYGSFTFLYILWWGAAFSDGFNIIFATSVFESLLIPISIIISSYGIRTMRKWGLYLLSISVLLLLGRGGFSLFVWEVWVLAALSAYLWTLHKKFS